MKLGTEFTKIVIIFVLGIIWLFLEISLINTSQIVTTRWNILILSTIQMIIILFIGILSKK